MNEEKEPTIPTEKIMALSIYEALTNFQREIDPVIKDSENGGFVRNGKPSTYATLTAIWNAIREPLTDNGLSIVQKPYRDGENIGIETIVTYWPTSEKIFSKIDTKPDKPSPHALASVLSYLRRYSITALLGLVQDDDDGNTASGIKGTLEDAKKNMAEMPPTLVAHFREFKWSQAEVLAFCGAAHWDFTRIALLLSVGKL